MKRKCEQCDRKMSRTKPSPSLFSDGYWCDECWDDYRENQIETEGGTLLPPFDEVPFWDYKSNN